MGLLFSHNHIAKIRLFTSRRLGYVLVIAAAALAGLIHSLAKPLLSFVSPAGIEINPITLAAIIYVINGLFFTSVKKNSDPVKKMERRNLFIITMIGLAEISGLITYFFGLKQSTAVNASILTNGEIIFSVIIALSIFRERLHKREFLPFLMIILGIILLPMAYEIFNSQLTRSDLLVGNLLILLSGVFYAVDISLCKYISGIVDPKRITQLVSFVGAGFAIFLLLVLQIPIEVNYSQLPSIALLGLFGTGVATFFFLTGLKLIGAMRTVLLYSTNFVFGVIFAVLFLHEGMSTSNVLSIILATAGIFFLRNRLGKSEKVSNQIEK